MSLLIGKKVIHFSGHSCSGKSTVSNIVVPQIPGLYSITYDMLKRKLTDYHRDKDRFLVRKIQLGLFDIVCQQGIPIYLEYPCRDKESYEACLAIAHKYGYDFLSFTFTASDDILIQRFRERMESIATHGGKASINTMELFLENLQQSFYCSDDSIVIDTSFRNIEDTVQSILQKIYT